MLAEGFSSITIMANSEERAVTGSKSEVLSEFEEGSTRAGDWGLSEYRCIVVCTSMQLQTQIQQKNAN